MLRRAALLMLLLAVAVSLTATAHAGKPCKVPKNASSTTATAVSQV